MMTPAESYALRAPFPQFVMNPAVALARAKIDAAESVQNTPCDYTLRRLGLALGLLVVVVIMLAMA